MKNSKILNDYKLLVLLLSYFNSEELDKVNNALIRKPVVDKLIKVTNFSDIDDSVLNLLEVMIEKLDSAKATEQICISDIEGKLVELAKNHAIPISDSYLLKKWGIKDQSISGIRKEISHIFPSQKFLETTIKNFRKDIFHEIEAREKKISKLGINKGLSLDDSILIDFNKKLSSCKSFNDVENLLLYYTTTVGGDLINGFLNGDLTVFNSKKPELKSSWGTPTKVSFNLLIDNAIKALELKKKVIYGALNSIITVYRGIDLERLLRYTKIDKDDLFCERSCFDRFIEVFEKDEKAKLQRRLVKYINVKKPIYQTNSITSTSLDRDIAVEYHSKRHDIPILMTIALKKGTAFGKDFSKTSFGSDDYNREVILKPSQKIKLNSAKLENNLIILNCVTQ